MRSVFENDLFKIFQPPSRSAAGLVPFAIGLVDQVLGPESQARWTPLLWACHQGNHQACVAATTSKPIIHICLGCWLPADRFFQPLEGL